jgi:hypothetical protein
MAHEAERRVAPTTAEQEGLTDQELYEVSPETSPGEIEAEVEQEIEEEESKFGGSSEWIARDVVELLETMGASGHHGEGGPAGRLLARFVLRQSVKAVLFYTRAVVKRMMRNPNLKRKLQLALRRGPRSVSRLVAPAVLGAIPRAFRQACPKLVGFVIRMSFRQIARNAGLRQSEIDIAEIEKELPEGQTY